MTATIPRGPLKPYCLITHDVFGRHQTDLCDQVDPQGRPIIRNMRCRGVTIQPHQIVAIIHYDPARNPEKRTAA